MNGDRLWRWFAIVAAVVLGVAILIGVGLAVAWQDLPPAHITIDGESISLPALQGWQAALALVLAVVAIVLTAVLVVGLVAISLVATVLCVALVVLALAVSLLLVFSPLLLLGWLLWRLSRSPQVVPGRLA